MKRTQAPLMLPATPTTQDPLILPALAAAAENRYY